MTDFESSPHADEARERWGQTAAYAESKRRSRGYTQADWDAIRSETERIEAAFATAMGDGAAPDSEVATDLAEQARLQIDRWFYPCSHEMHARLGRMYLEDPRFTDHYERRASGLAAYVAAAIEANARRAASGDPP